MAEGAQVWEDPKNGIIVRCEASPKAVAMLRFFADSMEDFLKEKRAKADAALAAKPWDDLITEGWAAPSAAEGSVKP